MKIQKQILVIYLFLILQKFKLDIYNVNKQQQEGPIFHFLLQPLKTTTIFTRSVTFFQSPYPEWLLFVALTHNRSN
jgi:hypothetical protein